MEAETVVVGGGGIDSRSDLTGAADALRDGSDGWSVAGGNDMPVSRLDDWP